MTKKHIYYIDILTHDMIKKKNDEKEFIKNGKYFLLTSFLNDNDFENYKFDTPYIFKFKKIPYNETELSRAEDDLMIKYFSPEKRYFDILKETKNRIEELKPYNLMLTVEVKDENNR